MGSTNLRLLAMVFLLVGNLRTSSVFGWGSLWFVYPCLILLRSSKAVWDVACEEKRAVTSRAGSCPQARAQRLKIFTPNRTASLSVAMWLGLALKGLICTGFPPPLPPKRTGEEIQYRISVRKQGGRNPHEVGGLGRRIILKWVTKR
jgi:hypothetical protein